LRFVSSLGKRTVVTLGNHDLHLLAVAEGFAKSKSLDTLDAILNAPDRDDLLAWLRQQKLLHVEGAYAMVHAGLMPMWSWQRAQTLAREVETILRGRHYRDLLKNMYGNDPDMWNDDLASHARHRVIINSFTRMRALEPRRIHRGDDEGYALDMRYKGAVNEMPASLTPWFRVPSGRTSARVTIAGHWSALGLANHIATQRFIGIDTGCIWGGALTAFRLEDRKIFQEPCREENPLQGVE
jgi:bis(5'-nucleosyl)-tetraphosphatase (symmetrical)